MTTARRFLFGGGLALWPCVGSAVVLGGLSQEPPRAENVVFLPMPSGIGHVFYDLVGDAQASYNVTLNISQDGGETFAVMPSVTGDAGPGITAGPGKHIIWQQGQDVERLQVDQLRFRVTVELSLVEAEPRRLNVAARAVSSEPAGATVLIDGEARGNTPIVLDLQPREFRLTLALDGYLDNSQVISLDVGRAEIVQ